jgi:ASC-1-like (ASCH) protein
MPEILHLTLKREYFAQIAKRQKHIEYRKQKPYWRKRLEGRKFDEIKFRNGYGKKAPEMRVEFHGIRRVGKGRSAEYAIRLGRILEIKRWPKSLP